MERIILNSLKRGQIITMLTGESEANYRYQFTVKEIGKCPLGLLMQTDPQGNEIGPERAELLGSGTWTTAEQNPMQRADWFVGRPYQERALTIGWGVLYVGGCAVVRNPGEAENTFYELQPALTNILVDEVSV